MSRNLAIFLFDEVEVLDFAGPYEVFSVTGLRTFAEKPFNVYTVAEKSPVVARNGLTVMPDFLLDNCPVPDIFLIPGGGGYGADGTPFGSRREMYNRKVLDWVQKHSVQAELVLSVCTGAFFLGMVGLLDGKDCRRQLILKH